MKTTLPLENTVTTIGLDTLQKLTDLLHQRDTNRVSINHTIGKELYKVTKRSSKPVAAVITLSDKLRSKNIYVSPLYLLECLSGFLVFQHQNPETISPQAWQNAVKANLYKVVSQDEIQDLIELEMAYLEHTGLTLEDRIQRIRHYLTKTNGLPKTGLIVHTGDLHFDDDAFLDETVKSAEFILKKVEDTDPILVVIAGDIVHTRQLHDSTGLLKALEFITKLANVCPVFVLHGTKSHDGRNLNVFGNIKAIHPVYVSNSPEVVYFNGYEFLKSPDGSSIQILSLPLMEVTKTEELQKTFELFRKSPKTKHRIFVSHGTVKGASNSSGYLPEADYTVEELLKLEAEMYLLGHIHKAQKMAEKIFYSGSIVRRNSDETEDKGFWIHDISNSHSEFIIIPTRRILKIEVSDMDDLKRALDELKPSPDDLVKVTLKIPEEKLKSLVEFETEITAELKTAGITNVKLEKSIIPSHVVRVKGISSISTLEEKCKKVAEILNIPFTATLLEKLRMAQVDPVNK